MLRILAGGFEIANVDEHVRGLHGESTEPPFRLGALAAAWSRLARAPSLAELRAVLSASIWGDRPVVAVPPHARTVDEKATAATGPSLARCRMDPDVAGAF